MTTDAELRAEIARLGEWIVAISEELDCERPESARGYCERALKGDLSYEHISNPIKSRSLEDALREFESIVQRVAKKRALAARLPYPKDGD
jgi:hypothetical protein